MKILEAKLAEAGFEVASPGIKSLWNPSVEDLAKIPALVEGLLGGSNLNEDAGENGATGSNLKKYVCKVCGYVYDPAKGDPDSGIAAGTAFEDLPEDWGCPLCGVKKDMFEPYEE